MSPQNPESLKSIKALVFDVFGTVVDWRTSVEAELKAALAAKLAISSSSPDAPTTTTPSPLLPQGPLQRAQSLDPDAWAAAFAQEWRDAYKTFTATHRAGDPEETPWKDIDAHHRDSLAAQLARWGLGGGGDDNGLWTPAEVDELSRAWHRLRPWPDAAAGLAALHALGLGTATLSNGTRALLADLCALGRLEFGHIVSAEDFRAYKPDPRTYRGAAAVVLGGGDVEGREGEVAMVAAHLNDLAAARAVGLRTIYVERKGEEDWPEGDERRTAAREWVDLWVGVDEGGFVEVARRLAAVLKD